MPLRVLVVDDDRDAADSLGLVLEHYGSDVRVAYSGPDALAQATDFCPQVGLLGIDLPGMTGLELARRLRDAQPSDPLLLIAVTGVSTEGARERAAAAGFDDHLAKPADSSALYRTAWDLLRAKYPNQT